METDKRIIIASNGELKEKVFEIKNTFSDHGAGIEEIISKRPPFVVRWGLSVLFGITLSFLVASWFIQYPDKVSAGGTLNSINAPKEVVVQNSGKLIRLFVKENQRVNKKDVLGYMESLANYDEVVTLSKTLDSISFQIANNQTDAVINYLRREFNSLGELQSSYQVFSLAFEKFSNYLNDGFYLRKRAMLDKDVGYLQKLHATLLHQEELMQEDLLLADTTFKTQQHLKEQKVISALDFRSEKSKLLAKQMTLPQISSSIINNESLQNEKQKEIEDLENEIQQQKSLFVQSLNTFKSQVEDWKKKFLLISPIDGSVSFSTFLQENQLLRQGQVICFISPGNSDYYVEALIPQYNFGKVKAGQAVLLKFQAYPYQEFGSVRGKIEFINNIPSDSGYLAKVSLPEGLVTNYKKIIQYRTGLSMQIDIITNQRTLLERFFSNFRSKLN